jgi:uncharacterized protein YndB with AHSA1/START domain
MRSATVSRTIAAPAVEVFDAVADVENYGEVFPTITKIEFLSEQRSGVGTRFRETRKGSGRDGTSEVEVTEYVDGDHIHLVDDYYGAVWDTLYSVVEDGGSTRLTMAVEAQPHRLAAKLTVSVMMSGYRKNMEKNIDAVKAHCEAEPGRVA